MTNRARNRRQGETPEAGQPNPWQRPLNPVHEIRPDEFVEANKPCGGYAFHEPEWMVRQGI